MTDVQVTTLPGMVVAALRRTMPTYADEGDLWKEIMSLLERSSVSFPDAGISGATFHDSEYRESDVDIEVWIQVKTPFPPSAPLKCRTEPERDVVCVRLEGDYSPMPTITQAMGVNVAEHQLATGPMFNIYRVSPMPNPTPALGSPTSASR